MISIAFGGTAMKKALIVSILCIALTLSGCCYSVRTYNPNGEGSKDSSDFVSKDFSANDIAESSVDDDSGSATSSEDGSVSVDLEAEKALSDFKLSLYGDNITIAVAYLGYCEGDYTTVCKYFEDKGIYEKIPFLKLLTEADFANAEGNQLFVAVPITQNGCVVVSTEGDEGALGEEILQGRENMPVFMRGNYSDSFPNLVVTVKKGSTVTVEYRPWMSTNDGGLFIPDNNLGVSDFTPYELLDITIENPLVGYWYGEVDFYGSRVALLLTLKSDFSARYDVGYVQSEIDGSFVGVWKADGGILSLNLVNITQGSDALTEYLFEWSETENGISLKHIDGETLVNGLTNETFTFAPRQ